MGAHRKQSLADQPLLDPTGMQRTESSHPIILSFPYFVHRNLAQDQ